MGSRKIFSHFDTEFNLLYCASQIYNVDWHNRDLWHDSNALHKWEVEPYVFVDIVSEFRKQEHIVYSP